MMPTNRGYQYQDKLDTEFWDEAEMEGFQDLVKERFKSSLNQG